MIGVIKGDTRSLDYASYGGILGFEDMTPIIANQMGRKLESATM